MRLHVVGLPHNDANTDHVACAYGQKHKKFAQMMMSLDHEVFSYYGEHSDMVATEHIVISSDQDKEKWFGNYDHKSQFYPITWGPLDRHWLESNSKAIQEIRKRIQTDDIICLIAGYCQKQIADEFPDNPIVEYGIGYEGSFSNFRVFESYSHMHWVYGKLDRSDNGRHYDCVIPNYFDPYDFTPSTEKSDYYVFLGRFIRRKGVEIAVETTRRLGARLVMAGQGCIVEDQKFIGEDIIIEGDHLTHIGHVNATQKAALLAGAKACFMPTLYIEPFGGVAVEAMLSGTPVIASDFGAFTEIVQHELDGYRFRTMGEAAFYAADQQLNLLDNGEIVKRAEHRFSMETIKYKYNDYFEQVTGAFNGTKDFYSDWHGRLDRFSTSLDPQHKS